MGKRGSSPMEVCSQQCSLGPFDHGDGNEKTRSAERCRWRNDPRGDALTQCRKDGALKRQHLITQAHWHFFGYDRTSSIGADPAVLKCLVEEGILFTFHIP